MGEGTWPVQARPYVSMRARRKHRPSLAARNDASCGTGTTARFPSDVTWTWLTPMLIVAGTVPTLSEVFVRTS